jgi:hypothetical protein
MTMTRKQFLRTLAGIGAGAIGASALLSCGSDDKTEVDAPTSGANCTANGTTVAINGNHGHILTVSKADVAAAASKTYDISGGAGHSHSVTVTAAMFAQLAANTAVAVTSTSDGSHTHSVSISCA